MQDHVKALKPAGFASLHGGLLARKGQAQPAISNLEMQRRARRGDREGESKLSVPVPKTKSSKYTDKPRVTLRMTTRQQRLFRLVAAATDRSQQDILSMALDQHLTRVIGEELGHCHCLRRLVLGDEVTGCGKKTASEGAAT